jgi:AraC family L-rhamnose operon regulatory protein RhaS
LSGTGGKDIFPALRAADNTPLRESLFQLVTTILTAESEAEYSSTRYKLHKLLTWLQEHCFEEHNWQQLAEQFHLTTRTAFRHIKEATGLTPDNYLKRLRLVSARVKLRETEMTITEVAYLCGFANSNHFTTLYKKVFGLTPAPIAAAHRVKRGPQAGQGKTCRPRQVTLIRRGSLPAHDGRWRQNCRCQDDAGY